MKDTVLENPIWNSLRTDHSHLAEGDHCARRYPHEIGPLAGIPDQSEASYNSLRSLASDHPVGLFSLDPINARGNWTTVRTGRVIQMVRVVTASTTPVAKPDHKPVSAPPDTSSTPKTPTSPSTKSPNKPDHPAPAGSFVVGSSNPVPTPDHKPVSVPPDTSTAPITPSPSTSTPTAPAAPSSHAGGGIPSPCQAAVATLDPPAEFPLPLPAGCTFRQLNAFDAPDMVALAKLTEPGPFRLRTFELGNFYGIFHGSRLVSMAGKRMHLPGFIEVSGVCTHPDFRGLGYARALVGIITNEIEQTGRTPFLHAWEDNPAQHLYESLGFAYTRTFNMSVLAAA
jgi:GNAT superfamily N-acetyltransferase